MTLRKLEEQEGLLNDQPCKFSIEETKHNNGISILGYFDNEMMYNVYRGYSERLLVHKNLGIELLVRVNDKNFSFLKNEKNKKNIEILLSENT